MATRTLANTVNPDIIALNAAIFGYAGHSVLTPHAALQQIWWTNGRIEAKVTSDFINSKLRLEARRQLHSPIGFGDGLTDDTYMDWVLSRAKRVFLTLVDCGVPEQIFGIVDDSWGDDDLPISQDEATRLSQQDQRLSKFYTAQFKFLLRELEEGSHVDYEPNEVVPLEYIHQLPPAAALQKWSRVHVPEKPERVYVRRKISFDESDEENVSAKNQFLADVETSRMVQNQHIAPITATYAIKNWAYFLTPFLGEHTLKSFIDFRTPASLQRIEKADRYLVLLDWLYCLADAVSCLHENGISHTAIVPSNILIDRDNHIAFSDIGSLQSFQTDKRFDSIEFYNYGAPENYPSHSLDDDDDDQSARPKKTPSRFRLNRRRRSAESKISSTTSTSRGSSGGGHESQHEAYGKRNLGSSSTLSIDSQTTYSPVYYSPTTPASVTSHPSSYHALSINRVPSAASHISNSTSHSENGTVIMSPPPVPPKSGKSPLSWSDTSSTSLSSVISLYTDSATTTTTRTKPRKSPVELAEAEMAADIFSLGCIYLDILTFLMKRKSSDFVRHRGTKRSRKSKKFSSSSSSSEPNSGSGSVSASGSIGQVRKLDTSFHANLGKVETWMAKLEHNAFDQEHPAFRTVGPLLKIVKGMLCLAPPLRPRAAVVKEKVREVFVSFRLEGLPRCAGTESGLALDKMETQKMRMGRNMTGKVGGGSGGASPSSPTVVAEALEKMPMPFGTVRAKGGDGSVPSGTDNAPAPTIPFTTSRGDPHSNVQEGIGSAGCSIVSKPGPWLRRGRGYVAG